LTLRAPYSTNTYGQITRVLACAGPRDIQERETKCEAGPVAKLNLRFRTNHPAQPKRHHERKPTEVIFTYAGRVSMSRLISDPLLSSPLLVSNEICGSRVYSQLAWIATADYTWTMKWWTLGKADWVLLQSMIHGSKPLPTVLNSTTTSQTLRVLRIRSTYGVGMLGLPEGMLLLPRSLLSRP
jgi:hypothetical protein